MRQTSAYVDQIVQQNGRILEEIERSRTAISRVDELEKENKRLADQLEQKLKQIHEIEQTRVPTGSFQVQSAHSSEVHSGSLKLVSFIEPIEPNSSKPLTKDEHRKFVENWNKLCESHGVYAERSRLLQDLLRKEQEKTRQWIEHNTKKDVLLEKRNRKIKVLAEEIARLKAERVDGDSDKCLSFEGELNLPSSAVSNNIGSPKPAKAWIQDEGVDQDDSASEKEDIDLPAHAGDSLPAVNDIEAHHTSSTEGSSDPLVAVPSKEDVAVPRQKTQAVPSSPDIVEVISVRHIGKRKHHSQAANTPVARRIKVEDLASSPVGLASFHNLHESVDLDDIGAKVITPRKQKRLRELARKGSNLGTSSQSSVLDDSRSQSRTNSSELTQSTSPILPSLKGRESSILQPRSTNKQILPRTSDDKATKRRRVASDKAVGELMEDGVVANIITPEALKATAGAIQNIQEKILSGLLAKPSPPRVVLTPGGGPSGQQEQSSRNAAVKVTTQQYTITGLASRVSPQKRLSPIKQHIAPCLPASAFKAAGQNGISRPSSRSSRGSVAPEIISSKPHSTRSSAEPNRSPAKSEVGGHEAPSRPSSRDSGLDFIDLPTVSTRPRMAELFNQKPTTSKVTPARQTHMNRGYFSGSPSRGSAETSKLSTAKPSTAKRQKLQRDVFVAESHDVNPEDEPLRLRPLISLTVQDFRINPTYNQGEKHAYHEVVRGKEARKCLQGCTKPGCCGHKFRVLAQMSRNPDMPLTASQEEEDQRLMEEHLGDNAYKLRNMDKFEREEVLLQARTRDLANKHGKHRHAYERRASPPGFWDVDFPTTQEQQQDRLKAREQERQEVERRYQEAMRPGGAYLFRDE